MAETLSDLVFITSISSLQVVMKDRNTHQPRGFGFITFKEPAAAQAAVSSGPHSLDDRMVRERSLTAAMPTS